MSNENNGELMSVLIKGVEMPKNCSECPVALCGKYCRINQTYTTYIELPIRPDHCPLVEIPEKHGRLIDADELKKEYPKDTDLEYPVNTNQYVCETIDEAKTVLEAEDR